MFSKVPIRFPLCSLHIKTPIILKLLLLLFINENSTFNSKMSWLPRLEKI